MHINHGGVEDPFERAGAWALGFIGLILAGMGLLVLAVRTDPRTTALLIAESIVAVGLPAVLIYAGYWIGKHGLSPSDQWTVTRWAVGGLVVATFYGQWILLRQGTIGGMIAEPRFFLLSCGAVGATSGLLAGMTQVLSHATYHEGIAPARRTKTTERTDNHAEQESERRPDRLSDAVIANFADIASDQRRLHIIEGLREMEGETTTVDALVDRLVEVEGTNAPRRQVAVSLHHHHLPRLEDSNIIVYEKDSNRIRYTPSQYLAELSFEAGSGGGNDGG